MSIHVILYKDSNFWITQGIEYDFATQGKTVQPAPKEWLKLFEKITD